MAIPSLVASAMVLLWRSLITVRITHFIRRINFVGVRGSRMTCGCIEREKTRTHHRRQQRTEKQRKKHREKGKFRSCGGTATWRGVTTDGGSWNIERGGKTFFKERENDARADRESWKTAPERKTQQDVDVVTADWHERKDHSAVA